MKFINQKTKVAILFCLVTAMLLTPLSVAYAADEQVLIGDGSVENPYQISNADQLAAINDDLDAHYILMNDILLNDEEWTPIASVTAFTGSLDGKDFTIRGLLISGSGVFQGLFAQVGSSGELKNFAIEGSVTGGNSVGAFVGYNQGLIEDVVNHATVTADINGGGIVGYNLGTIRNSYNSGTVIGTSTNTGGIAGRNNGIIHDVYNIGSVSGGTSVGGIIGHNVGNLLNAYNTVDIKGDNYVGGVVGQNDTPNVYTRSLISNVYNSGAISSSATYAHIGGVVGYHYNGDLSNVYSTGTLSATGFGAEIGGVAAYVGLSAQVDGAYWLESSAQVGIFSGNGYNNRQNVLSFDVSGQFANTGTLLDTLNSGATAYNATKPTVEAETWVAQADGYPIFEGQEPEEPQITITGLTIKKDPDKKTYEIGDLVDLTGMVIVANMSDGSENEIAHNELSLSGFNSTQAETGQIVTVNYGNFSTKFSVDIVLPTPVKYTVQVNLDGGNGHPSGAGEYAANETVNIIAGTKSGFTFNGWLVSGDVVTLQDASSVSTSFIMPAAEVIITAQWTAVSGGGNVGGGSSGGGGVVVTPDDNDDEGDTIAPGDILDIEDEDTPLSGMPLPFIDVSIGDWFYDAVKYVFENDIMNGVSDTIFAPNDNMTRAMVWTVLARMSGVDTSGGDPWYSVAQDWAMVNEVSDGTNPDASITREEFATMLHRYAGSPIVDGMLNYPDDDLIADWAYDAFIWAVDKGIITGMDDGTLNPQGAATRAQMATMLQRYLTME